MPISEYVLRVRKAIHTDWLLMLGAAAVVFDDDGRVLLQKRSDFHLWGLPGGALEPGEALATAVVREVREETGLMVEVERLSGIYSFRMQYPDGNQVWGISTTFICRAVGGDLTLDDDETLELRWFAPDALPKRIVPHHLIRIEHAVKDEGAYFEPPSNDGEPSEYVQSLRQRIGHNTLLAVAVEGVLRRDDGQVFLVQRNGDWHLPGGVAYLFENPAQTLVRTIAAETGLDIVAQRLAGVYSGEGTIVHDLNGSITAYITYVFACKLVDTSAQPSRGQYFRLDALPDNLNAESRIRLHYAVSQNEAYFGRA